MSEEFSRTPPAIRSEHLSYKVARRLGDILTRTTAKHGLTGPEIRRFRSAMRFMALSCKSPTSSLWWLTTNKGLTRSLIADIWKRVGRLQRQVGIATYSALTFETRGGVHAHVVFIGTTELAQRLKRSSFGGVIAVDRVHDPRSLASRYLAKERTPQAGYGREHMLGGRLKGSHRLKGGGDRVRLSRDLERDTIEAGIVQPWQHTNAKRCDERKPYSPRRLRSRRALRPSGQLPLFPELDRPVSRLHDFKGGMLPPAVALEIEFLRRKHGWTQRQLGEEIGRCQGHIANAMRGHDPLSTLVVNRLREILPSNGTVDDAS